MTATSPISEMSANIRLPFSIETPPCLRNGGISGLRYNDAAPWQIVAGCSLRRTLPNFGIDVSRLLAQQLDCEIARVTSRL